MHILWHRRSTRPSALLRVSGCLDGETNPGTDTFNRPPGQGVGENSGFVPGVTLVAGVSLKPSLGIEVSVDFAPSLTFPWTFDYEESALNQASHRDVMILGCLRFRPRCHQRVCVEPVFGAGLAIDHAESVEVADCGPAVSPSRQPCLPIKGPADHDTEDRWIPTVSAGMDLLIRQGCVTLTAGDVLVVSPTPTASVRR